MIQMVSLCPLIPDVQSCLLASRAVLGDQARGSSFEFPPPLFVPVLAVRFAEDFRQKQEKCSHISKCIALLSRVLEGVATHELL